MQRTHKPPRAYVAINYVGSVLGILVAVALLIALYPFAYVALFGASAPTLALPTAAVQIRTVGPRLQLQLESAPPVAVPTPVLEVVPAINIAPADDPAPVILEVRPAPERWAPPAGAVPTEDASKGGREKGIFNPQLTHECRHGQQWFDGAGCKNVLR